MKTTVIHHSADFDGLFCREIARRFLPDAELIGWDFGDAPHPGNADPLHQFYILDLPIDRVFGFDFSKSDQQAVFSANYKNIVWIDHHASSIASHPTDIPGYRIDGVAACRLAWQWFSEHRPQSGMYWSEPKGQPYESNCNLPFSNDFIERRVKEPLAVRLAGEYDIWDKRDPRAELFQHGLRTIDLSESRWWVWFFEHANDNCVKDLCERGQALQFARDNEYREVITQQGFDVEFEGLTFLACNSHELDIRSQLFEAGIKPHHDGLLGFTFTGKDWRVSMYGLPTKPDIDFSKIAVKYGGGGHKHACGFRADKLPFL